MDVDMGKKNKAQKSSDPGELSFCKITKGFVAIVVTVVGLTAISLVFDQVPVISSFHFRMNGSESGIEIVRSRTHEFRIYSTFESLHIGSQESSLKIEDMAPVAVGPYGDGWDKGTDDCEFVPRFGSVSNYFNLRMDRGLQNEINLTIASAGGNPIGFELYSNELRRLQKTVLHVPPGKGELDFLTNTEFDLEVQSVAIVCTRRGSIHVGDLQTKTLRVRSGSRRARMSFDDPQGFDVMIGGVTENEKLARSQPATMVKIMFADNGELDRLFVKEAKEGNVSYFENRSRTMFESAELHSVEIRGTVYLREFEVRGEEFLVMGDGRAGKIWVDGTNVTTLLRWFLSWKDKWLKS